MFTSNIASRAISIWLLVALTFTAASFPAIVLPANIVGPVVSVFDGDTLEVLHNTHPERIRLSGIDCPEIHQAW